ncbi:unnamed protein product [Urochloa humidicola]
MEKLMIRFRRSNRLAGASGTQIPFRRAATLGDLRRPGSSTQIQSQGAKRKYLSPCASWGAKRARSALGGGGAGDKQAPSGRSLPPPPHTDNMCVHLIHFRLPPSWGAKRARSALGCGGPPAVSFRSLGSGGGKPALSVGSPPHPNNSSTCVEWANLGDGPAGRIAELALASDVADYVCFRITCRPWWRCSPDPRASGLDSCFLPREWIMLDKALGGPRCRRFLNISAGQCIRMDIPELDDHWLLALTPEGLLLLLHEATLVVRLLNPLTHQVTDFPRLTTLLQAGGYESALDFEVYSAGLVADASAVAVCFSCSMVLAVAKPGDKSWTVVVNDEYLNSTLPFAVRFYCATSRSVMVLSITSDHQPPRLVQVADLSKSFYFSRKAHSLHLVDNGGELMLVHRTLCLLDGDYKRRYDVYKVDLEAGHLIPVKSLNGRAVFMGMTRTISVSPGVFPSITADIIYLAPECDREILGYNIGDGSRVPRQCGPFPDGVCPDSIVECLCNCIQGNGERLD